MSFAAVMLKQRWIDGHVVLARRVDSPRFRRIESISPRNHVHAFRLSSPEEIDAELTAWITEAYPVGEQRHLRSSLEAPLVNCLVRVRSLLPFIEHASFSAGRLCSPNAGMSLYLTINNKENLTAKLTAKSLLFVDSG